jgi:hypothetical protein
MGQSYYSGWGAFAGADTGFILGGVYEEIGHVSKNLGHHQVCAVLTVSYNQKTKTKKKRSASVLRPCSPINYYYILHFMTRGPLRGPFIHPRGGCYGSSGHCYGTVLH